MHAAAVVLVATLLSPLHTAARPAWLSPCAMVASPDGGTLYIACHAADCVQVFDVAERKVRHTITTSRSPSGLALSADGKTLFVTCAKPESQVCVVDVPAFKVVEKLPAGHTAMAPVLSPDGKTLYVCNRFNDAVSVINLATKTELRRIPVRREPTAAAITPDGKRLLVANHLPTGRSDVDHVAAVVTVIDTERGQVVDDLSLPTGSGALNDLRISPDGKYAVVTHGLARFHLPTTQLDRGWMYTNAKTIIDLATMQVLNTVLLDTIDRGAANPWGAAWSADSKTLVVAIAGTHEISITDFPALLEKLAKVAAAAPAAGNAALPYSSSASRVPSDVPNDLAFLVGVRERRRLPEGDLGPRAVVVVGRRAYLANYFSDTLTVMDLDGQHPQSESIPLGPKPQLTAARQGELYFHDARICFQGWQSCSSCHPGDARVDALNWDLLNDGIGNPKNNKSLLLVYKTPPAMSLGARESAEAAVRAGIRHILFTVQPAEVAGAMDAYLQSLEPVPSPRLVKSKFSAAAKRGEKLFNSKETGCTRCHPWPLLTDLQRYDVGTLGRFDKQSDFVDTPTLVEIWRTAPYLHDGSAATIRDVLTTANHDDQHGKTSHLTADQLNDLIEFLLSL